MERLKRLIPRKLVLPITEVVAHEVTGDPGWHVAVISDDVEHLPRIGPHCSFTDLSRLKDAVPHVVLGLYHSGLPAGTAAQDKNMIVALVRRHPGLFSLFEVCNGALLFLEKFSISHSVAMLEAAHELLNSGISLTIVGGSDARKPGEYLPVGSVYTNASLQGEESVLDALRARRASVSVIEKVNAARVKRLRDRCPSAFAELILVE